MVAVLFPLLIILIWIVYISQKSLTPNEVLEQKDSLIGKTITVTGRADISSIIRCTLMFCPPDNECCNSCSGYLVLSGEKEKITLTGTYLNKSVECSGNDCKMSCYPLEKSKTYKATGLWKKELNEYNLQLVAFSVVG